SAVTLGRRHCPGLQAPPSCFTDFWPRSLDSIWFVFFNDTTPPEIYTLSLHDALPISSKPICAQPETLFPAQKPVVSARRRPAARSEEHTSELQSLTNLVCRLLLEKKKTPPRNQPAAS